MRIGFAGLGALGSPMARRCASVHQLQVWNRTRERAQRFAADVAGVTVALSPRALAEGADAVITCLPTSADVAALLEGPDGLLAGLASGSILIDCTSGDPEISRQIAARLAERGIDFVDAPVSGGPPLAATGALTIMCGGSAAQVARAGEVLAPCAARQLHLGPTGAGHAMKAVNNALLAVHILAVAEGLVTAAKAGISPADAVAVLNASSGRSFVSEALVPERVLSGTWAPNFRLALLEKDLGIAHTLAQSLDVVDPVLAHARERYRQLRAELGETADYLAPIQRAEIAAGVALRG